MSNCCLNCGGLILEPNKAYGYSGQVCHCPIKPGSQYQIPENKKPPIKEGTLVCDPKTHKAIYEIENERLQREIARLKKIIEVAEKALIQCAKDSFPKQCAREALAEIKKAKE